MFALYARDVKTRFEADDLMELVQKLSDAADEDDASKRLPGAQIDIYVPEDWAGLVDGMHCPVDESDDVTEAFESGEEWLRDTGMPNRIADDQLVVCAGPSEEVADETDDFEEAYGLFDGDIDLDGMNDLLAKAYPTYGYYIREM